jgi:hypothetical protein
MSDSPTPQTIDRLADVLQRHKVEYCVIGGVAANYHGSPRVTYDIDILSRGGLENLTRLAHAITELGGRVGRDPQTPTTSATRTRAGRQASVVSTCCLPPKVPDPLASPIATSPTR